MTSASDRDHGYSSNRIFRIALVLSLVLHLVLGFIVYQSSADFRRVLARINPRPQPTDETVSLSTAFRIDRRTKAQPQPHSAKAASRPPAPKTPPHPQERPVAVVVPKPVAVQTPVPPAPSRVKHELAKIVPHAAPAPPKTTVAKIETTTPTAPPATPKPEKVVASIERPQAVTQPQPQVAQPGHAARLSDAQLAQIQADLAKSIVRDRAENNPLSNVSKPVTLPAAYHRSAIDFSALAGDMREAQGLCDPLKSWQADGWDYYYAECTIQEPDGSVARKAMPWPVRWRPRNDPWTGYAHVGQGPMPLPPPGWRPDRPIDPDFIPYLRKNGYPI